MRVFFLISLVLASGCANGPTRGDSEEAPVRHSRGLHALGMVLQGLGGGYASRSQVPQATIQRQKTCLANESAGTYMISCY